MEVESTTTGVWELIPVKLIESGQYPKSNLMFLTFFVNTIKAVHDHADLMRASIGFW